MFCVIYSVKSLVETIELNCRESTCIFGLNIKCCLNVDTQSNFSEKERQKLLQIKLNCVSLDDFKMKNINIKLCKRF
jgi:hypothetical protein